MALSDNAKCVRLLRKPTCNTRLVWAYLALSDNANYASCINGLYAMPIVQRPGQFCWVSFSVEFWQDTNSILLILGKNGSKWSQMVKNTNFGPSPVMNGGPQSKKHCQRHYGPRRWLISLIFCKFCKFCIFCIFFIFCLFCAFPWVSGTRLNNGELFSFFTPLQSIWLTKRSQKTTYYYDKNSLANVVNVWLSLTFVLGGVAF